MKFDPSVPQNLKETQVWFAGIITQPIDVNSHINPVTPTGHSIEIEASKYICPNKALKPFQRIEIYNQQYWWRILGALQDVYPTLTRLFGYTEFNNKIATPYFVKYPSIHWDLNLIGSRLPQFIKEEYHDEDTLLINKMAEIDWVFTDSFLAPHYPAVDPQKMDGVILKLQPHIHLFTLDFDLFWYREEFQKEEPDYWTNHSFPELKPAPTGFYVFYRNLKNQLNYDPISKTEFEILNLFKRGSTLDQICEWLEKQNENIIQEASENLHYWIQSYIVRQWLV